MTRHVIRAVPVSPCVTPSRRHRLKFGILFVLIVVMMGGAAVVSVTSGNGTELLVFVPFAVAVGAILAATAYALMWPRARQLVLHVDAEAGEVQVSNWWGIPPLVLLGLLGSIAGGLGSVVHQVAHPGLDLNRYEAALPLVGAGAVYYLVKCIQAEVQFTRLILTSDFLEVHDFFRSKLIEWRNIKRIGLVASPRVRIRILHGDGLYDLVPGPFDSDRRLIVDLLQRIWQDPALLDDLDEKEVRALLEPVS